MVSTTTAPSAGGPTTTPLNEALTPVPPESRVFGFRDHMSLWFSLGVGLLVMQVGAFLVPALSLRDAMLAVVGGSLLGAGLLAWVGRIGCASGLSSAGLINAAYGRSFSKLPVFLNIVQLIGWATFELVVMRDGTIVIGKETFGVDLGVVVPTLFWGSVVVLLLTGSVTTLVRRIISRFGLPLVVLSLIWLTTMFAMKLDGEQFRAAWSRVGEGGLGVFGAIDLVIAMPVSWLPLVADYARHGRSARTALSGTWVGFAIANIWCYGLGVLVITVAGPDVQMLSALLLAQGGLIALGFILVDELDNTYGDLYSGAVSSHSIVPKFTVRTWGLALAVLCIGLAMVAPMDSLEPFLLTLSSVFVPLFGTILGRLGLRESTVAASERAVHLVPAAIWVVGVVFFHALAAWAPGFGSALPTLALTFALGALSRRIR